MEVFSHDVNDGYPYLMSLIQSRGYWERTRNGNALAFPQPVMIHHTAPWKRVLFDPIRDANPFFHYMEAIWMLSGSKEIEFPAYFVKQIREYSDDGVSMHGAYGYRWRRQFGEDQIESIVRMLVKDPTSRRIVLTMWNPASDLEANSRDLPCNTHIYFRKAPGENKLNMTVCNRSNDLVWGCFGANVVHMSILHEYIARSVGMELGIYSQFTNNLHLYEGMEGKVAERVDPWYDEHPTYASTPFSAVETLDWREAGKFVKEMGKGRYGSPILKLNAVHMMDAYSCYKTGPTGIPQALTCAGRIHDDDWREACTRWLTRRVKNG